MAPNSDPLSTTTDHHLSETETEAEPNPMTTTTCHGQTVPSGLTPSDFQLLQDHITEFHTYRIHPGRQCSSLVAQKINASRPVIWSILRRFDQPQSYKHFVASCTVESNFQIAVGATRDVKVISGLPATTSTERLDVLDDERYVFGFSIIGGEHRLTNYRSVTTVHELEEGAVPVSVVLESYVLDVPEGNSEEDTRLFVDTVVRLNLQKLAAFAVGLERTAAAGGISGK